MPRERGPFLKYVKYVEKNKWKCIFCGLEYCGNTLRIRAHLAGIPRYGIKACEKVEDPVRAEALETFNGQGSGLDKSTGGTSGKGTEGIVIGASQSVLPSDDASDPNDTQNSGQLGCVPQQPSFHQPTGSGTAPACPQDQGSLSPGNRPLDNLDNTQQSDPLNRRLDAAHGNENASSLPRHLMDSLALPSLDLGELLEPLEQSTHLEFRDVITPDAPLHSPQSNLHNFPPENFREFLAEVFKEIEADKLHDPAVVSSLQIDPSLDLDGANCLQDCGQLGGVEVVPVPSNRSPTNIVRHPGQLPPRCDKENGNDIRRFPSPTQMEIDPSIAPQHLEVSTNTIGPSSAQELDMNEGVLMRSQPNTGNDFEENRALKRKLELYSKEAAVRGELEFAASLSLKKPRMEVVNWLANVEKLRNDHPKAASEDCLPLVDRLMHEAEDLMRLDRGLFEVRETKAGKLLEEKMVGEAFQRNTTKILEFLVGNKISRLGIYGMGGVGKTTIMVHIHNRLLEEANFGNVSWITVSQDINTQRLQDDLWKELGMGILQEKDVRKRAAMLCDCLTKRGKSTIILDDVWGHFDFKEVGIPVRADGIKLVLTTRSIEVCHQMQCEKMINIEPLFDEEAESLFLEELGFEETLNLETKAIVKSIVKECAGLPLAVITMATSMRGVIDVFEWKDCLKKLRDSNMGQTLMENVVLKKLELSYNRLGKHEVQQCFLSCALYPEDKLIHKYELIAFFIDQGLFGQLETMEEQYFRGHTILNKLVNVCLLEDHGRDVKMHDLIRDMALHVMSEISIVKVGKGLRRIPYEEYWTKDLEKASLMENEIREFPLNMSPNCPKLSTLLFNKSLLCDMVIPDSFFKQLWGLKVLNLSECKLRGLPNSISDLVHLTTLLLRLCMNLRHIPYLGKLTSLRKLDLLGCVKLEAIKGLEMLVNLTYLDIAYTHINRLPKGTLEALLKLQYLSVHTVNEEDIIKLRALEALRCQFVDVDDFNNLVRVVSKQRENPRYYNLMCRKRWSELIVIEKSPFQNLERRVHIATGSHRIVSTGRESSGSGISILIPQHVRTLSVFYGDGPTNLSDIGLLENLEELSIYGWKNLRVLSGRQDEEIIDIHDSLTPTPAPLFFLSLRDLSINDCLRLKYLFGHGPKFYLPYLRKIKIWQCKEMVGITEVVTSRSLHPPPAFPTLEDISIWGCNKMKRVVESEWLPHFPNLRKIKVCSCENMEEIIGGPPPYMPVEEISLEWLLVKYCNNMRKLFPHELLIHLRNLQKINVEFCKGMVEMISGAGQDQEGSIMTSVNNNPSSFQSSISLPKLNLLVLSSLPQLKSICEVPITCDSMEHLKVYHCPELNKIPLQLQLGDTENLPHVELEGEEKWKTLIWHHPNAEAILQPHLHFQWGRCILKGRCNSRSKVKCEFSNADFKEV